ncbi:MAG: hypothetical protein AVDCRST_MAG20-1888 [uncultured Acidimicrobiales bacterium]|uniref:TY-Chap N-terminal domain-containing protein n=1 Tax=uncultured Acidimicrobiales bacterium TaxID=310071 RepID=A0A6J4I735_9ACTN|nr:MAG: hypothetical protein AVDCRST_MAG20-1888 [uncultured Acidimicrobiales bacterium]
MWVQEVADAIAIVGSSRYGHAIFEIAGTPYYVQIDLGEPVDAWVDEEELGFEDRHLVVEARSNNYLYEEDERLTDEQGAALERLGWLLPGSPCDTRCGCGDEHRNWFRYATVDGIDATGAALVAVVLATFGVYGAGEDVEVDVSYDCSAGKAGTPYCD